MILSLMIVSETDYEIGTLAHRCSADVCLILGFLPTGVMQSLLKGFYESMINSFAASYMLRYPHPLAKTLLHSQLKVYFDPFTSSLSRRL